MACLDIKPPLSVFVILCEQPALRGVFQLSYCAKMLFSIQSIFRPFRRIRSNLETGVALFIFIIIVLSYMYRGRFSDDVHRYLIHNRRNVRVHVVNSVKWHDEVIVPVAEAWLSVPNTSTTVYLAKYRFGMRELIARLGLLTAKAPHIRTNDIWKVTNDVSLRPDILILTTCTRDYKILNETLDVLFRDHHTRLFCLFHNTKELAEGYGYSRDLLSPWIQARRIDFVAISQHVADSAQSEALAKHWPVVRDEHFDPPMHTFMPVFEYLPEPGQQDYGVGREAGFAVQGHYSIGRNTTSLFPHLQKYIQAADARKESTNETNLHLVGFGQRPEVPEDLQDHVIFDENLGYDDFYGTLMKSDAIVPLFNTKEYYETKASSSVAASLIAGTPLIADKRLLEAYTYLNESMVWMQGEGEDEMATLGRVLALSREERQAKKAAVRKRRAELIEDNRIKARAWTADAVRLLPRGWDRPP